MSNRSEIESLVYLLEDPDPYVREKVLERFQTLGGNAVPVLDEVKQDIRSPLQLETVNSILFDLVFPDIYAEFHDLILNGFETYQELERALILLSQFGNPTLRPSVVTHQLDHMAHVVSDEITYALDQIERMNILLSYIFSDCGFKGTKEDYHNPDYSYLNKVLQTKTGIPISLSIIVLLLGERLELPFYGINMPMHFLLMYQNGAEKVYVDAYQQGASVSMDHIGNFLKMNGVEPKSHYFTQASYKEIVIRWIRNMQFAYQKRDDVFRINKLGDLLELFEAHG
jgi:regulator of sirC expression with transglutaminase-like and TPR domain